MTEHGASEAGHVARTRRAHRAVGQVTPQPPQFAVSLRVSTQAPPHAVSTPGHWHTPAMHDCPLPRMAAGATSSSGRSRGRDTPLSRLYRRASGSPHRRRSRPRSSARSRTQPQTPTAVHRVRRRSRRTGRRRGASLPGSSRCRSSLNTRSRPVDRPHPPQLAGSFANSTQLTPQRVSVLTKTDAYASRTLLPRATNIAAPAAVGRVAQHVDARRSARRRVHRASVADSGVVFPSVPTAASPMTSIAAS